MRVTPPVKGFTLTELAIVLGIIGLILGAIWTAAAKVYANNRVTKAVNETIAIANGVRAIYSKGYVDVAGADVTSAMVNFGVYPADMIQTTCPAGAGYGTIPSPCPVDPWGVSAVQIATGGAWYGAPNTLNTFQISFFGGTIKDCPAYMAQMLAQATSAGIVWMYAGNTGIISSPGTASITAVSNCTGQMTLQFSL